MMELENKPNLLIADYVVIENQPSFKNPRMKSIATTGAPSINGVWQGTASVTSVSVVPTAGSLLTGTVKLFGIAS